MDFCTSRHCNWMFGCGKGVIAIGTFLKLSVSGPDARRAVVARTYFSSTDSASFRPSPTDGSAVGVQLISVHRSYTSFLKLLPYESSIDAQRASRSDRAVRRAVSAERLSAQCQFHRVQTCGNRMQTYHTSEYESV